jgi:hypothetical protein
MSTNTKLSFLVVYEEQEFSFQLFEDNTVRDLKKTIFKKFGIAPHKQVIDCWFKDPSSDTDTLITCCSASECNNLLVEKKEGSSTTSTSHPPENPGERSDNVLGSRGSNITGGGDNNLPSEESGNDIPPPRESETSAILSFVQYFSTNFSNRGITFLTCCLEDAFTQAFETSIQRRRALILYLHNKNDAFSKTFCEQLTQQHIQQILNDKFLLLCWDVEENEYTRCLIEALENCNELRTYRSLIELKVCGALVMVPTGRSFRVISVMKGTVTGKEFSAILTQAGEFLTRENDVEQEIGGHGNQENTFGSKECQQHMLDMLGNRDYDSFDHDELKYLKEKVAFAFHGPPQTLNGYDRKQNKKTDYIFEVIMKQNNLIAKWKDRVIISFIYMCTEPLPEEKQKLAKKYPDYNPSCDFTLLPIFVLRKCKNSTNPCRVIIDNVGRVYQTWNDFLDENKLPECEMIFPKNGRYQADANGNVILDKQLSPACNVSASILLAADVATTVGGLAAGGIFFAAAFIPTVAAVPFLLPAAGVTGLVTGAYALGRSGYNLYDKYKHGENLSFWESSEARAAYINIVAGSLGFVGAGANVMMSNLISQGFNVGNGARAAMNTVNVINLGASGVGLANSSYDVFKQWWDDNETPSPLTIIQLSASVLFFGQAVYNFRTANMVVEETQARELRDYNDSLRSNRHRKTFSKLIKETIRQNDGNVQRGQADVISTIKNIQNKDEVFATLTRANKDMNHNNIRFAAQNGKITLNGVSIDMGRFSSMGKNEAITFFNTLPNTPNPTAANVRLMETYLGNSFEGIRSIEVAPLALGLVKIFCTADSTIKEKIINTVSKLIAELLKSTTCYMTSLNEIFPDHDKYLRLVGMVSSFFQTFVTQVEERYNMWRQTLDETLAEPYFTELSCDVTRRAAEIFNFVTANFFTGTKLNEDGLRNLLDYFYTWFANQVYLYQERRQRRNRRTIHSRVAARKLRCRICWGDYYSPQ